MQKYWKTCADESLPPKSVEWWLWETRIRTCFHFCYPPTVLTSIQNSIVVRGKNNQIFSSYIFSTTYLKKTTASIFFILHCNSFRVTGKRIGILNCDIWHPRDFEKEARKKRRRGVVTLCKAKTWFYAWFEINVEQMWEWEKMELCFLSLWATKWHRRYISPPHKVVMSWKMMLLPLLVKKLLSSFLTLLLFHDGFLLLCRCSWSSWKANGY